MVAQVKALKIDGLILAGGMARRMGGEDKGLIQLDNQPMIQHVINRLQPQVQQLTINANRNHDSYRQFGFEVICDKESGYLGPLAGMLTGLSHLDTDYLMVVPCDCPLLPLDLVSRMLNQLQTNNAELAVASDGKREQPVVLLLSPKLLPSMQAFLDNGERKIDLWYAQHQYVVVPFDDQPMAFVNVNTPEQKQQLAATLTA